MEYFVFESAGTAGKYICSYTLSTYAQSNIRVRIRALDAEAQIAGATSTLTDNQKYMITEEKLGKPIRKQISHPAICPIQIPVIAANDCSRYSLGVTPDHFLNALRKALGSEKPSKYVICSTEYFSRRYFRASL